MPLREAAARRKRADPHRRSGLLRQPHHQVDRLCAIDAGADHEGRALARRKRFGQRLDRVAIGTGLAADAAGFDRLRRMIPVVDRHRDKGRPARRLHRHVIGARDRRRDIFGPRGLDREFDVRPRKFRGALGIEKRLQRQDAARLLAGGDHQRGLVAVRGEDIAERMADAGARMQIDKTGVAGGLGVAVGHADHGGFLQAEHVIDIVGPVGEERQFGRAGIAEHFLDAERAQQIERRVFDGEGCRGGFCRFAGQCQISSQVYFRHARACPGHPRLDCIAARKAWMAGTSPAMTIISYRGGNLTTSPSPSWSADQLNSRSTAPCRRPSHWRSPKTRCLRTAAAARDRRISSARCRRAIWRRARR